MIAVGDEIKHTCILHCLARVCNLITQRVRVVLGGSSLPFGLLMAVLAARLNIKVT